MSVFGRVEPAKNGSQQPLSLYSVGSQSLQAFVAPDVTASQDNVVFFNSSGKHPNFKIRQIRDLEARVEVLSGDKEERIELMTLLVRNLLKENKDLRGMVKTMAGFVGEGK